MKNKNQLRLPPNKELIIKYCILSSPEILSKSYSSETIKNSYVSSGMLDAATQSCPCLFGIMKAFDINWKKLLGGKKWFMSKLKVYLQEMYLNCNISEQFYAKLDFPLDADNHNNKYILNSEKDHLCRSKILYHPKIFADKKSLIDTKLAAMDNDKTAKISTAEAILRENKRCELTFLEIMSLLLDSPITTEVFELLTIDQIMKANVSMLSAFIKIRLNENLFEHCSISTTKDNPMQVRRRDIDKKTKVHYC
jgi:hypothetical protein